MEKIHLKNELLSMGFDSVQIDAVINSVETVEEAITLLIQPAQESVEPGAQVKSRVNENYKETPQELVTLKAAQEAKKAKKADLSHKKRLLEQIEEDRKEFKEKSLQRQAIPVPVEISISTFSKPTQNQCLIHFRLPDRTFQHEFDKSATISDLYAIVRQNLMQNNVMNADTPGFFTIAQGFPRVNYVDGDLTTLETARYG